MRNLIIFSFLVTLMGCGIKHKAEGNITSTSKVDIADSNHNITILAGITPETIEFIEDICNNQSKKQVADCISDLIKVLVPQRTKTKETLDGV